MERLLQGGRGASRVLDAAGLRASVAASLGALLSVRAPAAAAGRPAAARTVLDYGAPAVEGRSAAREADRDWIAGELREAVLAFEPRLDQPIVSVLPDAEDPGRLRVRIAGAVSLGRVLEPFEFVAPLGGGPGGDL